MKQIVSTYSVIAKSIKGEASVLLVDCSTESGKRTCKAFKASPEPVLLKYFIRGHLVREFQEEPPMSELLHFIHNPFESNNWQDPAGTGNVIYIRSSLTLEYIVKKASGPVVLLIYIPLLELCEEYKTVFGSVAARFNQGLVFVGADYSISENEGIKHLFNTISIPMLLFLSLLVGTTSAKTRKAYSQTNLVNVMSRFEFEKMLKGSDPVLTMFYLEGCYSCDEMIKAYEAASAMSKQHNISGIFAAAELSTWREYTVPEFVKSVPMLIFHSSIDAMKLTEVRFQSENEIVSFMASPKAYFAHLQIVSSYEHIQWPENVVHLTVESFSKVLRSKKHAMVLFYTENLAEYGIVKYQFGSTATAFIEERQVFFGAVNCQSEATLCRQRAGQKLPQINYYNFLKRARVYNSDFTTTELSNYLYTVVNSSAPFEDIASDSDFFISRRQYLHLLTPFGLLTASETFPRIIVYFFLRTCERCVGEIAKFRSLAESTPSTFLLFAYVDCVIYYNFCARDVIVNNSLIKFYAEAEVEKTFTDWITFENWFSLTLKSANVIQ
ncbi:hypothetical protein TTRE_0000484401 [Trichuris trichiura]|uniref:Thioredoxin domain-containing protein n=1 Tax=Trichuris trichiura TaxID=36087 RepID=A0A077Z9W2_TRITR|nr:hypothetical protein TTRE_0000484401 [Trichuris trichiura]